MKPINFKYVGNGTYVREKDGKFAGGFWKRVGNFINRCIRFAALWLARMAIFAAAVGIVASFIASSTVTAQVPQVVTVEAKAAVMDRIADCESGNGKPGSATQFKNGQVVINVNTNGTYDQGKYQINSIHNAAATKLGFNLATEEGNTGFAKWMYANLGTGDWYSSQKCWGK